MCYFVHETSSATCSKLVILYVLSHQTSTILKSCIHPIHLNMAVYQYNALLYISGMQADECAGKDVTGTSAVSPCIHLSPLCDDVWPGGGVMLWRGVFWSVTISLFRNSPTLVRWSHGHRWEIVSFHFSNPLCGKLSSTILYSSSKPPQLSSHLKVEL